MRTTRIFENLLAAKLMIKTKYFLCFFLLNFTFLSFGQRLSIDAKGIPFVKNYTKAYHASNGSTQAMVQDHRQVMYFGNQDGVLEFDGSSWNLIPTSNQSFPKALAVEKFEKPNSEIRKKGRIYTGGIGEFGYLQTDSTGKFGCVSLIPLVPEAYREFEDIWQIHVFEELVVFHSIKFLFLLTDDTIKVIDAGSRNPNELFHFSFSFGEQFFVRQKGKGLLELEREQLQLVAGGEAFASERIYEVLPFTKDTLLIATRSKGLMLYDGKEFIPWENEANNFLTKNLVYCGVNLDEDTFAFGTLQGGIVVVDRNGKLLQVIDKARGLLDDLIFDLFVDKDKNLWVGQTNGISHIDFSSPFQELDERIKLEGQGFTSIIYDDHIWFGTLHNLFKMPLKVDTNMVIQNTGLEAVKGSNNFTMSLTIAGNVLLAGQTTGVISIDQNHQLKTILKDRISFSFLSPKDNARALMVGTQGGLVLLENTQTDFSKPANWIYKSEIEGFNENVFYLEEGEPNEIWISDEQKGIFRLRLNTALDSVTSSVLYDETKGLPSKINNRVFKINDEVVFATEKGIYRFDRTKDSMIVDAVFEKIIPNAYARMLTQQKNGDIWMWANLFHNGKSNEKIEVIHLIKKGESYELEKGIFGQLSQWYRSFYPKIKEVDDNHMLFMKPDGLVNYKLNEAVKKRNSFPLFIRQVANLNQNGALIFTGNQSNAAGIPLANQLVDENVELAADVKNLRFTWSALSYVNPEKTQYSFLLEGFDETWSSWSEPTQKEYTNIPFGKYRFKVKARNILGQESEEAVYVFEIQRPWYWSWQAILGYIILGGLLIRGIVQLNIRRLVQQKEALENVVQERTKEIQEQKTEIEKEKQKSEEILLNILPKEIAEELKTKGSIQPRQYTFVSVLFTDFLDFTRITKQMEPEVLVPLLDSYFSAFDQIISKYDIEKIKTMGDSFMCAGGVPQTNETHAVDIINAGLEMRDYVEAAKKKHQEEGLPNFEIRIGINTGPLVAGVVGSRKYAYDIWGATVNLASRMESSGLVGEVNISKATYELVKDKFECTYRGKVEVKKMGLVDMYVVKGVKSKGT